MGAGCHNIYQNDNEQSKKLIIVLNSVIYTYNYIILSITLIQVAQKNVVALKYTMGVGCHGIYQNDNEHNCK
jgi:hypothetical protein